MDIKVKKQWDGRNMGQIRFDSLLGTHLIKLAGNGKDTSEADTASSAPSIRSTSN
ncbi:MAG: hypothetical protein U5L00_19860 [Desulfovermiculus sp.]|nr:hypothetical protein [Desulfovermiculus sp.]